MDIVLTTFNARYSHSALALRCLRANLGTLRDRSVLIEFDNRRAPQAAAEALLAHNPRIILFSVYIWNLTLTSETVAILKTVRPEVRILIGGPEVSSEYEDLALFKTADHLIRGEGEPVIEAVCRALLHEPPGRGDAGHTAALPQATRLPNVIDAPRADLRTVALPYEEYTDEDIAHRRIYVESSRGCPGQCEYCLSALDECVRFVPPVRLFPAFGKLIERGARIFKFIDRSFNINAAHAAAVLRYFLKNRRDGMMLHLEWEPTHLPPSLEQLLRDAPPGFFQLEVGVQTFNPDVAERIHRNLNIAVTEDHLKRLSALPSVYVHADLIAGLPGESLAGIAAGFDRLHACGPDEIQLGILKKLRGAPIARHDQPFDMVYNSSPPYDVLQTADLSFVELQALRRFARYWDLTVNNGRFAQTAPLLWRGADSVFAAFMDWSNHLYAQTGSTAGIAPVRLARFLEQFLIAKGLDPSTVFQCLESDLRHGGSAAKGRERQTRKTCPRPKKL